MQEQNILFLIFLTNYAPTVTIIVIFIIQKIFVTPKPLLRLYRCKDLRQKGNYMEDSKIIELYNNRSESAIAETASKYGAYLNQIAFNILANHEDTEECVSDCYMRAWNAIPPTVPRVLRTFLGRITRNLALDAYLKKTSEKRGSGIAEACIDELAECLASGGDTETAVVEAELVRALNSWLEGLEPEKRRLFVKRYWHMKSIAEISAETGLGESNVKVTLHRMREALRDYLTKEGFEI